MTKSLSIDELVRLNEKYNGRPRLLSRIKGRIGHLKNEIQSAIGYIAFRLSGKVNENHKFVAGLRNKYAGKRCFIVCNGPSLRMEDLEKIKAAGDISIGINFIARAYDHTTWRPDFVMNVDPCIYDSQKCEIARREETAIRVFRRKDYLRSRPYCGQKIYLHAEASREYLKHPHFAKDITDTYYSIGTSTYGALQLAVHLGCKEIYIIGCDMSYAVSLHADGNITRNKAEYFYKPTEKEKEQTSAVNKRKTVYPIWEMEIAFMEAERHSRRSDFRIYNATRGGYLEVFKRVNFDSLF